MNYSKAIKTIRTARNLTQKELASSLGFTPNYISKIESGERTPSTEFIQKFCRKLNIPYYLFALLASEDKDLGKLPRKDTNKIAENLLNLLVSGSKNGNKQ